MQELETVDQLVEAELLAEPVELPFFYAVDTSFGRSERLYRVYLNEHMIAGARVAGQHYWSPEFWLEATRRQRLAQWIMLPYMRRVWAKRYEREVFYETVDPFADDLASFDRHNFQLSPSQILRIRFHHKHLPKVIGSVAVVQLQAVDGRSWRLAIVDDREPAQLVERLRKLDPAIEVIGEDKYNSAHDRHLAFARRDLLRVGIIILCFGLSGAIIWSLGLLGQNGPKLSKFVIVCTVLGLGALIKAWRMK